MNRRNHSHALPQLAENKAQGAIPPLKKGPSRVVTEFIDGLEKEDHHGKAAADLGCGLGRNSFYLASCGFSVTALDFVQENVDSVNDQAELMELPVHAFTQDVTLQWPVTSNSLDIAIDLFCYKHITDKKAQKNYRKELGKALKTNGYYLISLTSIDDEFYSPLLKSSPSPSEKLILDPHTRLSSYLYSMEDLTAEFSDLFTAVKAWEESSKSSVYGKQYVRKVLNAIFQKK